MGQPFIIITATDPTDPMVGSSHAARRSMSEVHGLLLDACDVHGLNPFVFIANEDPALASVYDQGAVNKIVNVYQDVFPLFNMLMSALGENGLAETQAVFFDDAMSFDVEVFVECWRRVYPMVPLPPFFGMIHATDRGGYAQQGVLDWHREQVKKLSLFREVFSMSDQAAENLRQRGVGSVRVVSPYFGLDERQRNRLNTGSKVFKLNWIYSFSHVDSYDKYILLVNQLNTLLQEKLVNLRENDEDLTMPERFSPRLFSRELPEGVALPRGLKPGDFAEGQHSKFDVLETAIAWPDPDSVTISFRPNSEIDYRLLKLAEVGHMVMAPDSGIYRETLDPVCTYPAAWLDHYDNEVPEKITMRIAEEFYERLLRLKETWYARHGKKNVISGSEVAFVRRIVRNNIKTGPENVADHIFTHLGLAY